MNGIFEGLDTSAKIKAFMATRNIRQIEIADLLNMTTETIRQRLNANRWEITELRIIADKYGIEVRDLI